MKSPASLVPHTVDHGRRPRVVGIDRRAVGTGLATDQSLTKLHDSYVIRKRMPSSTIYVL